MSVEGDDEFRESLGGVEGIPLPSQAVVTTQFRGMDTALFEAHAQFGIIETTDVSYAQEENADLREGLPGPRATCRHRSSTHDAELSGR